MLGAHLKNQYRRRGEGDWCKGCHHHGVPLAEVALVLVLVSRAVLAENGTGGEPAPSAVEHQSLLEIR